MICEKPQAALKIATALAESNIIKKTAYGSYWFEFERKGIKHACVPAVGHLFVLDADSKGWEYPIFDMKWVPTFNRKEGGYAKSYFKNLENMAKKASDFIVCCDYDTEGDVIGYNILRFICKKNDAKRMKFSTLTKTDIIEAYENMMNHLDFGQVEAGLTRHYLDFIWGINTTRALTLALKRAMKKGFTVVSTGRVQGPTLALLTQREREIKNFKSEPYWELGLHALFNKSLIAAFYEKGKIWEKEEAQKIYNNAKGKDAIVKDVEKKKQQLMPPVPFDTITLQTESYRCFGYSPAQTLSIAESLYTQGFISYPRTSSQQLPEKIGYKNILQNLSKIFKEAELVLEKKELKPMQGKKTDPAHPAIYPTSQIPILDKLNSHQKRVYELIARRFMSTFGDPAFRESTKIKLDVNNYIFISTGLKTISKGWLQLYGKFALVKEIMLPEVKVGDKLEVKDLVLLEKETQPPDRYSQASILKEMEKRGLGTKATRSQILQTLYERGYIFDKSIKVTDFGQKVIETLEKYCPKIISEELTRKFEEEMEAVAENKKKREDVVKEAEVVLKEILAEFKVNEDKIGNELAKSYLFTRKNMKIIGKCPKCSKDLIIITSKAKKRFIGCSGYKEGCEFSFPLPKSGNITKTDKKCEKCGYPLIMVRFKRKPLFSCININCETNKNWFKGN